MLVKSERMAKSEVGELTPGTKGNNQDMTMGVLMETTTFNRPTRNMLTMQVGLGFRF
jgi:hypothetical protein